MRIILVSVLAVFISSFSLMNGSTARAIALPVGGYAPFANAPDVVVSEIQTGSEQSAADEFIEIYNSGNEEIDLNGWKIEYKSSTGGSWTEKAVLSSTLGSNELYVLAVENYFDGNQLLKGGFAASGGHIRLSKPINNDVVSFQIVDTVGWGSADSPEGSAAMAPKKGTSIQRCLRENNLQDSDNNAVDLISYEQLTPGFMLECAQTDTGRGDNPGNDSGKSNDYSCEGIVVSEIMPNAAGSDTGNEFIELYNPTTDYINLRGCGLQLGGKDEIYRFENIELEPEQYTSFSDDQTGITLPNSSGGTVYLLSADDTELQTAYYPGGLDDDVAFAWFGLDEWEKSYSPTPGSANISQPLKPCPLGEVRSKESGRCRSITSNSGNGLKPCNPGQYRNPATNRCKKIDDGGDLKPCGPDQFRNPETNRCKKKNSGTNYKPCKPGQARNPETNRCKSTASAASKYKPCNPGQERNPETNRCRKVASASAEALGQQIEDIEVPTETSNAWWLAGGAMLSAGGYGLWEWRNDLRGWLAKIKSKISRK